jgi:ArsR family transcriptional regulator
MRDQVRVLDAVADENRMRILKCLQVRPACVCELVQATLMPQPRVSRHLRILRDAGLVSDARDAQWVEYSLAAADSDSPVGRVLALVAEWLEDDPQVVEDRGRYETASRDQCAPGE